MQKSHYKNVIPPVGKHPSKNAARFLQAPKVFYHQLTDPSWLMLRKSHVSMTPFFGGLHSITKRH